MLYTLGSFSGGARGAVRPSVGRKVAERANRLLRYFPGLLAIVVALLTSGLAQAAGPTAQFGIRPATPGSDNASSGYFILKANPGETLKESVVIANPGTIPVSILLYPVDAGTGDSGGAVYLNQGDARNDVGSWITLDTSEVDVPPSQQATVSFTIVIPAGARTGDHLGGVVGELARNATPTPGAAGGGASQAGFGITTVTRAVTAVLLTVGPAGTPSLKITGAKTVELAGFPTLVLLLHNDGSALVKPQGTVSLTDAAGKTALSSQLKIDTVVPQTAIDYPVQVDLPTQAGTYQVHASRDYGGTEPAVLESSVVVAGPGSDATAVVIGARTRAPQTSVAGVSVPSGVSPIIFVVAGMVGTLLIVAIGLGLYSRRSRRRSQ